MFNWCRANFSVPRGRISCRERPNSRVAASDGWHHPPCELKLDRWRQRPLAFAGWRPDDPFAPMTLRCCGRSLRPPSQREACLDRCEVRQPSLLPRR